MDAGFEVSWAERKRPYHLDARQQAIDLYYRVGVRAFLSEYQQWLLTPRSPGDPDVNEDLRVDPDMLARKLSGYDRYVLPPDTQWITGGIDVQQRVLYYILLAVAPDFSCSIIDYGTYPETKRAVYYASTFAPTLKQQFPGKGQDGAVLAGLRALVQQIMSRPYDRADGVRFAPSLLAIDSAYLGTTVRRMVDSSHHAQLVSCLGRSIGPDELPMSEYRQRPGERLGENWLLRRPLKGSHRRQHLLIDKYYWCDFAARRLLTADGDPGALTIYGRDGSRLRHTFLARQLTAEVPTPKVGRNRVNIWDLRPGGETENHYWDALHYALVCASICGATIEGTAVAKPRPRTRWQAKF